MARLTFSPIRRRELGRVLRGHDSDDLPHVEKLAQRPSQGRLPAPASSRVWVEPKAGRPASNRFGYLAASRCSVALAAYPSASALY